MSGRSLAFTCVIAVGFTACGGGGGFPDAPSPPDAAPPGSFSLDWSIKDNAGNAATCMQANAKTVLVNVQEETTGSSLAANFPCSLGSAASGSFMVGTYTLRFSLLGDAGLITTAPAQMGIVIKSQMTAMVAPVTFNLP